jgi:chromosomal replication initiator protein
MSPFHEACLVLDAFQERHKDMADIAAEVARKYSIPVKRLRSRSVNRSTAAARQEAMVRCRNELDRSTVEIGRYFHRDHTTVCYALRKAGCHAN